MRTYRGIVCEKHDKYMIFITQNGEFHKGIPLSASPEIGEEVEYYLKLTSLPSRKKQIVFKLAPVLLAALLFIFIGTSNLLAENKAAAAYIQLNSGQSIEIAINEKGNVISVKTIADDLVIFKELEGLAIDAALNSVMDEIYKEDEELSISTKFNNDRLHELKKQVENAVIELQENFTKTNSKPKDNLSTEKLDKENSKSTEPNEEMKQHLNPKNEQINDDQTPANSSSNPRSNSNHKGNETQDIQDIPNQSLKQEKTKPSVEKPKNEKQDLPNNETPTRENEKTKVNNSKAEKNNENDNHNK